MSKKYLIFGATGSIGSSIARQLYMENKECHLIGRNESEIKKLADDGVKTELAVSLHSARKKLEKK